MLRQLNVGGFVFPFANPRHAHEYRVLKDFPLDDDQIIVAGVINSVTNFVEHPETIADRIERVAEVVGDPTQGAGRNGLWVRYLGGHAAGGGGCGVGEAGRSQRGGEDRVGQVVLIAIAEGWPIPPPSA